MAEDNDVRSPGSKRVAVGRFCDAITDASMSQADIFCDDVELDATVPDWHFVLRGSASVRTELSGRFADPGRFENLRRTPLPDGELVQFDLSWEEGGVPHSCRQAHILDVRDSRIATDTVWCGGRWPASLLADMQDAQRAADRS